MSFYVYILERADGSYYTGHTDDLNRRLQIHHDRSLARTRDQQHALRLVFTEEYATREEAIARELQIKGWSRRKEALIRQDWAGLQAESHTGRGDDLGTR